VTHEASGVGNFPTFGEKNEMTCSVIRLEDIRLRD
jgi:hypothetical protein